MTHQLLLLTALVLRLPNVETFEAYDWKPRFTPQEAIRVTADTVGFFTHSSRHFDPLCLTQDAVNCVARTMKAQRLPTLYLHDQFNDSNPAWMYLYSDWRPTAFVSSDVGHFDMDLSAVQHAVFVGGYFGQCERSTLEDVIRCWQRDGEQKDLRVTQVLDAIFSVCEHVRYEDPFAANVRSYFFDDLKKRNSRASIPMSQILQRIDSRDQAIDLLCRQLPVIPRNVNVVIDFFGHRETVLYVDAGAPILTFAYRTSDRFLACPTASVDPDKLVARNLRRSVGQRTSVKSVIVLP